MARIKKVFLIIDLSRYGVSVYFLSPRGELLDKQVRENSCLGAKIGWREYDPLELIYTIRSAMNTGLMLLSIQESGVTGLGVTGDPYAYLLWDRKSGLALSLAIDKTCPRLLSVYRSYKHHAYAASYK